DHRHAARQHRQIRGARRRPRGARRDEDRMTNPSESGLGRNQANSTPLQAMSFLAKAAHTSPHKTAVVHGDVRRDWRETYARCRRLASALARRGVGRGETVAAMLPNVPAM